MSSKLRKALEKYKSTGNNDFFFLRNDKDTAVVRFLYGNDEDELDWYVVHEAEIGGKKRWVQCTEGPECPFCQAGKNPQLKLFIQLLDTTDNKVKTWERGQTFIGKLLSNMERYGALNSRLYEIERNGEAGSQKTTYEMFPLDPDNVDPSTLPKKQELLSENGFILQKDIQTMQQILEGNYQFENVQTQREQPTQRQAPPQYNQAPPAQNQQYQQPPAQQQQYQAPPNQQYQAPPQQNQQYQQQQQAPPQQENEDIF